MKNSPSLKSKEETPKTPGGISKCLLTPCRRVGLSRNWRKSVASPFNSPLASSQVKQANETRKRKEILGETPEKYENDDQEEYNVRTPVRKVELPHRKKSKTFLNSINNAEDDCSQPECESPKPFGKVEESESKDEIIDCQKFVTSPVRLKTKSKSRSSLEISTKEANKEIESKASEKHTDTKENHLESVNTPICLKSKRRTTKKSPKSNSNVMDIKSNSIFPTDSNVRPVEKENVGNSTNMQTELTTTVKNTDDNDKNNENDNILNKEKKSPNNLTKECIVVIQKKIFKKQLQEKTDEKVNTVSQALFNDSDSDDVPLNNLTKSDIKYDDSKIDDDFASQPKLKKTNSKISLKKKSTEQIKITSKAKERKPHKPQVTATSQSSIEDDDDFFEKKKTIIVRKTYDKVMKPLKAKSTGSITQKDIEDLKARIETKKKMLLAKSMTDTKELRELIKKWQKGCQDALMELMDLMKNKCPDQHMEYSQILQSLNIPASLVGYDSDNDCFVTPEDENIILSHVKE